MIAVASGFSKFTEHENHLQSLLIHKLPDLMPRESDSVGLECSCLRIGIFKFPGNAVTSGLRTTLCDPLLSMKQLFFF